jgi:hypothetical protein
MQFGVERAMPHPVGQRKTFVERRDDPVEIAAWACARELKNRTKSRQFGPRNSSRPRRMSSRPSASAPVSVFARDPQQSLGCDINHSALSIIML